MGSIVLLYQGQSALLAGFAGLFALATAELLAAMTVTAVVSKVSDRTEVRILPRRLAGVRDRYVPRPLDVFLVAALALVGVELLDSQTAVAATLAGLSLGTFGVAAVLFGALPEDDADDDGEGGEESDDTPGVTTPSTAD